MGDSPGLIKLAVEFMEKYNLLPNDALILGNAKSHQVGAIASFDPDFTQPCQKEGIKLFDNVDLLKNNDDPPSIWESLVNEP
ncbi:MAG: PIN domain-containing protein [Saprospirales bacterium]|nr:PIN domain-containing protein [Saprospirales bacterium]